MFLQQQLTDDMKTAMKAKDSLTLGVVRFLQAEIRNVEIDQGQQDDAGIQKIVARQIKQIKDTIPDYEKAGRTDLVKQEQAKLSILEKYLPEQISDRELEALVKAVLDSQPDAHPGQLIGQVMKQVSGRADGSRVSAMVKRISSS